MVEATAPSFPNSETSIIECRALLERPGMMEVVHELLERLEAHLKADDYYSVVANMRGSSAEEVASLIMSRGHLGGLQVDSHCTGGHSHYNHSIKKKSIWWYTHTRTLMALRPRIQPIRNHLTMITTCPKASAGWY